MSNDLPALSSLTESTTDVPVSAGQVENYVLLLVLLSVFAGGTLVLLSLLLLFCHRCCMGGRRYSRASDDLEKTNTTYAEDSQPTQEITIRLDDSDALSASSRQDVESERFISTGSIGRRVSFNESALYEQDRTTQDKGRRYTLTEGDFHHLKKARLTHLHLHLPPAPSDMKILTIMECDSTDSSTVNISQSSAPKPPLAIYKPPERRVNDWTGTSLSGGLPGDRHHSTILDQSPRKSTSVTKSQRRRSQTTEACGDRNDADRVGAGPQTSVLHFLSKLRRHASLEGIAPYFRRWKFDSNHRAASLDAKGSPKRKPFQRQRAASETTEHTEGDSSPQNDASESFPQTPLLQSLSAESLSHPETSSVFLSRLNLEAMVEMNGSIGKDDPCFPTGTQGEVTVNGTEEEHQRTSGGDFKADSEDENTESVSGLFGTEQEAALQEQFENLLRAAGDPKADERTKTELEDGEELVLGAEARCRTNSGSSCSFGIRQESLEAPPSLYRDIWSLRASLEQYVSSDQSSTDRESIRSDADSVSSLGGGGGGGRPGLDSCLSQDLDDDPEGNGEGEAPTTRGTVDSEMSGGAGGEGEGVNRKLLQMDSGYASIEAPPKAPEDMRLFGTPGAPRGKTASERRLFFTSSRKKGSVCESMEARLFQEELEDEMTEKTLQEPCPLLLKSLHPQKAPETPTQLPSPLTKSVPQPPSPHCPRLRRRDYSIDEKTDALFNEFLRHDPQFDQQDSPYRSRHRSRVHLRKQWQRHKQYSDPGSSTGGRYSPTSLERQRFSPLRRGDSAGYPLDTRYHSTLSRIASAADEEASEEASKERAESLDLHDEGSEGDPPCDETNAEQSTNIPTVNHTDPRVDNKNNNSSQNVASQADGALTDKLATSVEERLYGSLRGTEQLDHVLTAANAESPGLSPI
ncbi:voltage-dependent calcium channel beta subunit-associated regulatory protein-like [Gouania willdenowi]|uniref:Voltage-dependent calcium channel beta subunit-associated regulatory protein-like n=1 Tax=Gouania willdenowi TaxID=441366 RepID=A0A8C5HFW4_GOUWI|nr:voltage-dependent calcium channel beta subunit-associated regulatory protein-like [Gouania willdenowi]